jgi:hypothetical protein
MNCGITRAHRSGPYFGVFTSTCNFIWYIWYVGPQPQSRPGFEPYRMEPRHLVRKRYEPGTAGPSHFLLDDYQRSRTAYGLRMWYGLDCQADALEPVHDLAADPALAGPVFPAEAPPEGDRA